MPVTSLTPPLAGPGCDLARAERRLADAEAEFEAAVGAGRPMAFLVAREHEVLLATAAVAAVRDAHADTRPRGHADAHPRVLAGAVATAR